MRRFLALLLLFILPLQLAFAASAGHCALDEEKASWHFAHHEHDGGHDDAPGGNGDDKGKLGHCEAGSEQLHPAIASIPSLPQVNVVAVATDHRRPQHVQEPSERPPRISLA